MKKRKLKIAIFHFGFFYSGGGERLVLEEMRGLKQLGHEVVCFTPVLDKQACFPDLIKKFDIKPLIPQLPVWFPDREALQVLISCVLFPILTPRFFGFDVIMATCQPGVWFSCLIFKIFGKRWLSLVGWLLVLVAILASQFSWQPIWYWQEKAIGQWESKKALAEAVAKHYQEGKILFFENHPASTYWLVYHHQIEGDKIVGQMFDPYFYMEGDFYENWGENREIILNWLKKEDIRLMAFFIDRSRYLELVGREPEYFEKLDFDQRWNLYIYKVRLELI